MQASASKLFFKRNTVAAHKPTMPRAFVLRFHLEKWRNDRIRREHFLGEWSSLKHATLVL